MKIISHRGNLTGPNPIRENSIDYIEEAIAEGFDVEVDLWVDDNECYLGHDDPQYFVTMNRKGKQHQTNCRPIVRYSVKTQERSQIIRVSYEHQPSHWTAPGQNRDSSRNILGKPH